MKTTEVVALGYRYPTPTSAADLTRAIEADTNSEVKRHMARFVEEVGSLELGEWEEVHTATLDLDPKFVPYVGHVAWGENYRRGAFMAELNYSLTISDWPFEGSVGMRIRISLPPYS